MRSEVAVCGTGRGGGVESEAEREEERGRERQREEEGMCVRVVRICDAVRVRCSDKRIFIPE